MKGMNLIRFLEKRHSDYLTHHDIDTYNAYIVALEDSAIRLIVISKAAVSVVNANCLGAKGKKEMKQALEVLAHAIDGVLVSRCQHGRNPSGCDDCKLKDFVVKILGELGGPDEKRIRELAEKEGIAL